MAEVTPGQTVDVTEMTASGHYPFGAEVDPCAEDSCCMPSAPNPDRDSLPAAPVTTPAPSGCAAPSFEEVYEQHFAFAWRNLRRFGVPRSHLDDATQDLFLVVHRRLQDFEGRSSLRTWLAAIAWKIASEFRRGQARKGNHEPLSDDLRDRGPDPQEATLQSEALQRLDRLLRQLDDDKRAVFVLTEMEQMSAPEISEILGVNLNTVYSRLRAARKAFEAALANERGGDL